MFSPQNISRFFAQVLAGESATYDDHNWYTNTGLKGYIKGRNTNRYPLLQKDLSEYTIREVMEFQQHPRDNVGQLWATGRYQIIPSTLKGVVAKANISIDSKYNAKNQDKLGMALIQERSSIWKYLSGQVEDTEANLQNAALGMAKIWASIGVPYDMQGSHGFISKNQSYYAGGGDRAHVSTEAVQSALKKLRNSYGKQQKFLKVSVLVLALTAAIIGGIVLFSKLSKSKK
jgi:muramidase (phage lysozyme)